MEESILLSIKKLLGLPPEDTSFDLDIIININAAFSTLYQIGVDDKSITIENDSAIWSDYIYNSNILNLVKQYVFMKVKLAFDPPSSSSVMDAYKQQIAELEWRINIETNKGEY